MTVLASLIETGAAYMDTAITKSRQDLRNPPWFMETLRMKAPRACAEAGRHDNPRHRFDPA